jgi:hypothetical protein
VRQNLYTCCRCGVEKRTTVECDDAPPGWAQVTYQRDHIVEKAGDERQLERHTLSTHACESCCAEVVTFLEKGILPDIDHAFDDGGVA